MIFKTSPRPVLDSDGTLSWRISIVRSRKLLWIDEHGKEIHKGFPIYFHVLLHRLAVELEFGNTKWLSTRVPPMAVVYHLQTCKHWHNHNTWDTMFASQQGPRSKHRYLLLWNCETIKYLISVLADWHRLFNQLTWKLEVSMERTHAVFVTVLCDSGIGSAGIDCFYGPGIGRHWLLQYWPTRA